MVEPKYEKKLETLDELLNSDVVFGYNQAVNSYHEILSLDEFVNFLANKKNMEDCSDLRKYIERIITTGDISIFLPPVFATYVARELGTVDVGKVVYPLGDDLVPGVITVLFKKGNPLLERFNILMRRYLEAGLLEKLWTELQHQASLSGGRRFREGDGDIFFCFSVSHLMPAFVVLLVGTVLSSVVFFAEVIVNCVFKRRRKVFAHLEFENVVLFSSLTLET
jgi:hypothetical protein